MYPSAFTYHRATSVHGRHHDAGRHPDAKLLAGGHSLIPTMKLRLASPPTIVDLGGLAELRGIRRAGASIDDRRIDDASRHRVLEGARRRHAPSCRRPPRSSATPWCATGARSAEASRTPIRPPTIPPCVLALGATMRVEAPSGGRVRCTPTTSSRACSRRRSVRNEVLTEIHVPVVAPGTGIAYEKFAAPGVTLRGRRCGRGASRWRSGCAGARVSHHRRDAAAPCGSPALESRARRTRARRCGARRGLPGRDRCRRSARRFRTRRRHTARTWWTVLAAARGPSSVAPRASAPARRRVPGRRRPPVARDSRPSIDATLRALDRPAATSPSASSRRRCSSPCASSGPCSSKASPASARPEVAQGRSRPAGVDADPAPVLRRPRRGAGGLRLGLRAPDAAHPPARGLRNRHRTTSNRKLYGPAFLRKRAAAARDRSTRIDRRPGAADRRDRSRRRGVRGVPARAALRLADHDPRDRHDPRRSPAGRRHHVEPHARGARRAEAALSVSLDSRTPRSTRSCASSSSKVADLADGALAPDRGVRPGPARRSISRRRRASPRRSTGPRRRRRWARPRSPRTWPQTTLGALVKSHDDFDTARAQTPELIAAGRMTRCSLTSSASPRAPLESALGVTSLQTRALRPRAPACRHRPGAERARRRTHDARDESRRSRAIVDEVFDRVWLQRSPPAARRRPCPPPR